MGAHPSHPPSLRACFVCFTVDEENCREAAKQQRSEKNRTRRKLKLCFFWSYFVFKLVILLKLKLKLIHFQRAFRTNT